MLKQKKLKTILILIIKSALMLIITMFYTKKIEFMSTNTYKLQFYEYNNCKKKVNKLKL